MLNVGPLELLVVLAVALIVVGPERLPELARSVGRVIRQFRDVQNEVRDLVSSEVDDDVRQAASDFKKATGDLTRATDVKGAVRRAERTIRDETAKFRSSRPARGRTGAPPAPSEAVREDPAEAAGPPADRLVEDAAATPSPASQGDGPASEEPTASDPSGHEPSGDR
jgi:sec-independent protein translocase protein TatB